ncbi:hypothetical protein BT63DRAFT_414606 [Microthyrium microscopicum]|uniref:DUF1772-domain-containing protein n=1 Tax=Microthyrium microscopicum TaxID=703497 RepID=A0A6A6U8M4_9PEZI|nr:hypothetical protein BT63DRAFT_414606 [Microthyrium microscopicum]
MSVPFLHRDVPAVVRAAQLLGITGAAGLAGAIIGISTFTVPAILQAPAPLAAKQWSNVYGRGKVFAPPIAVAVGAIFGALAYREYNGNTAALGLYTAAAVLAPSIAPYTLTVMAKTNAALDRKAEDAGVEDAAMEKEETVHGLVDYWASLNLVRGLMMLASAGLGAWASLTATEVLGLDKIELLSGANRMG